MTSSSARLPDDPRMNNLKIDFFSDTRCWMKPFQNALGDEAEQTEWALNKEMSIPTRNNTLMIQREIVAWPLAYLTSTYHLTVNSFNQLKDLSHFAINNILCPGLRNTLPAKPTLKNSRPRRVMDATRWRPECVFFGSTKKSFIFLNN
uniref:Uncharacterized protein n=1 Tax=Romanomermis culicivorax TaxID=13658 RepID=A0A915I7T1_ROMCU